MNQSKKAYGPPLGVTSGSWLVLTLWGSLRGCHKYKHLRPQEIGHLFPPQWFSVKMLPKVSLPLSVNIPLVNAYHRWGIFPLFGQTFISFLASFIISYRCPCDVWLNLTTGFFLFLVSESHSIPCQRIMQFSFLMAMYSVWKVVYLTLFQVEDHLSIKDQINNPFPTSFCFAGIHGNNAAKSQGQDSTPELRQDEAFDETSMNK